MNTDQRVSAVVIARETEHQPPANLSVTLSWSPADPYAVEMYFQVQLGRASLGDATWMISRELLQEGLTSRAGAGIGDVSIERDPEHPNDVRLTLSSNDPAQTMLFDAEDLAEFLDDTGEVIPLGAEASWVAWDDHIASLLDTDRGWWPR